MNLSQTLMEHINWQVVLTVENGSNMPSHVGRVLEYFQRCGFQNVRHKYNPEGCIIEQMLLEPRSPWCF